MAEPPAVYKDSKLDCVVRSKLASSFAVEVFDSRKSWSVYNVQRLRTPYRQWYSHEKCKEKTNLRDDSCSTLLKVGK